MLQRKRISSLERWWEEGITKRVSKWGSKCWRHSKTPFKFLKLSLLIHHPFPQINFGLRNSSKIKIGIHSVVETSGFCHFCCFLCKYLPGMCRMIFSHNICVKDKEIDLFCPRLTTCLDWTLQTREGWGDADVLGNTPTYDNISASGHIHTLTDPLLHSFHNDIIEIIVDVIHLMLIVKVELIAFENVIKNWY